jgi:hypothetical protein
MYSSVSPVLPPASFLLLEDRLLILGGSEDVRSRGDRGRGFPFPTLTVSSWLAVSPTLLETSFSFGACWSDSLVAGFLARFCARFCGFRLNR